MVDRAGADHGCAHTARPALRFLLADRVSVELTRPDVRTSPDDSLIICRTDSTAAGEHAGHLMAKRGQKVRFANHTSQTITLQFRGDDTRTAPILLQSPPIPPSASWTRAFWHTGTFYVASSDRVRFRTWMMIID